MAKDAKGHGSEARGGSMGRSEFASQSHQGAKFQARQSMKAANSPDSWEARYGTQMDRDRLRADAINQGVDAGFKSSLQAAGLSSASGGQPVVSNAHAAATLAGGPKSAPVDTHPSMGLPKGVTMVSMGDPGKMHNAIAKAVGEPPVNPRGTGVQFGHGPATNRWPETNGSFRRIIK